MQLLWIIELLGDVVYVDKVIFKNVVIAPMMGNVASANIDIYRGMFYKHSVRP